MENEEKKGVCCGGKEKCEHRMSNCCHGFKKCRFMRVIFFLILLAIAFHMGTEWGEMKGQFRNFDGRYEQRGGMMNWGQNKFDYKTIQGGASDAVTVKVSDVTAPKQ